MAMTGRGRVAVLWDREHEPPPGPLLDAAALATGAWDWSYVGPETPVRPPTMVAQPTPDDVGAALAGVDVVVGVPTHWTLDHVVESGARFVAVVLGSVAPDAVEPKDMVVDGWPAAEHWPEVLDAAVVLDDGHHRAIGEAQEVAEEILDLLEEIRKRHLPAAFRSQA